MQQSGQNIILNQLSSAATSASNSREPSQENKKRQGRSQNRQGRRRTPTPGKKQKSFQYKKKDNNNKTRLTRSPYRRKSYSKSRSRSNSKTSNKSNKSYYKHTSKKQAWKSKICKYWKRGECKYGDQCEWQHYDFTQIDYCEQKKKERYNQTCQNGRYLVQITTVTYLSEQEILNMIGNSSQVRQAIAVATKNKKQSKKMKKEIIKEIRNGQMDEKQKIAAKKTIIQKYMKNMQEDIANELAQKKIQKKEQKKIAWQLQKEEQQKKNISTNIDEMRPQYNQINNNQQIKQRDIFEEYNEQMQYDIDTSPKNTQYYQNTSNNQMDFNQSAQEKQQNYEQINIEENQDSSNLYIDKIPIENKQEKQQKQADQQQQKSNQNTQDIKIQPGRYVINKSNNNKPQQRKLIEFFDQSQQEEKKLVGTGKYTEIMDDKQLEFHYSPGDINKLDKLKLIQIITSEQWTKENEKAVNEAPKERRDGEQNETWEKDGLIIVQINTDILNGMVMEQNPTSNIKTSPTYLARWAIISAILRFLEKKSDYRNIFTSQRMQVFLLNKIDDGKKVQKNTFWVTGMDTRAEQQIGQARMNSLCVAIKFN